MSTRLSFRPICHVVIGIGVCAGMLLAQDAAPAAGAPPATTAKKAAGATAGDEYPDLVEADVFGGVSLFGSINAGLGERFADGGVVGVRLAANMSRYVGIELWGDWAENNVEFRTPTSGFSGGGGGPLPNYSFGQREWSFALNPVFNLRPRGSKIQPYLTVGIGGVQFTPTNTAEKDAVANNSLYLSGALNDNLQPEVNYGGGIKWHFTDHLGVRVDVRGLTTWNPTFDLPNYNTGGIYIPKKNILDGVQASVGLVFYAGERNCEYYQKYMPPAPPAPTPLNQGSITGAEGQTICQGKPVMLHSTASGTANQHLKYAWTLNGQPSGSDSADFSFTPNNTGDFQVAVTVSDTTPPPPPAERPKQIPVRCWVQPTPPPPAAPVTATTTITVADAQPQITNISSSSPTLSCAADTSGTHTANLTATASGGACGGNLSYKWTVSEGSLTNDTTPNATFDASTLNFEGGAQNQTKTVTATLTVTTDTGKTASQSTQITVNCPPQFVRLDDVIFAKNKSRVNNCGKRVLIDEAAPRVANGDYDIVLVGHRDADETTHVPAARRRGRHAEPTSLDEQRALNAAAVLTGTTGTCGKVDPSRVKIDWVGTDQTSEPKPGLCGTSNLPSQKERRGQAATEADKNRRVEVYLVPHNSSVNPPAVKNARPLPADRMKALGCPK